MHPPKAEANPSRSIVIAQLIGGDAVLRSAS